MSLIFRTSRPITRQVGSLSRRTFTASSTRALKESDRDVDEKDYDKHKQDLLKKQKEGKGHWKSELGSNSEEAVKADRSHTGGKDGHSEEAIKELQKRTAGHAEKKHKYGTSQDDGL
ncbi:hypothetical protein F5884DRAFT_775585 [Xylogone sp. PMI_703]|nr:hypothetical protein F5884DRAFT_775585 [Xylogone sp. PMI_703]